MTPNKAFQSGHARAYIQQDPMAQHAKLFVTTEQRYAVTFDSGQMVMRQYPLQATIGDEYALMIWSEQMEDTVVDIFKAIAKAFDLYSDDPSYAYRQGYAEGEASVLRQWNRQLLGNPENPPDPGPVYEQMKLPGFE